VLSKALRYAADVQLIGFLPKVGMLRVERPEFVCWDLAHYKRILDAAKEEGDEWYVAACLAGEAGLRVGEIRALRWSEGVDLVAATITINQQTRKGITGTPKGRTRGTVPMLDDSADQPSSQLAGARLARPPSQLRDPRRDVRRESVEADDLDGAQAPRRDDAPRQFRREPPARATTHVAQ
jgi:integrase